MTTKCQECGGTRLSWGYTTSNAGSVVDGRLRLSDVFVIFYLGCDECSATVVTRAAEEVVDLLNLQRKILIESGAE